MTPSNAAPSTPEKKTKKKLKNPTWEHPKGSGIKIAEIPNKTGGQVFGVSYQVRIPAKLLGQSGRREMLQRDTKADAEQLAEDRFLALKKHGTEFSRIPADAQRQAAVAWSMLSDHRIDFIEAAKAAIKHLRPAGGQRTLAKVCEELRESKESRFKAGKLDQRSNEDFRSRSQKIEHALGDKFVSEITADDLRAWLGKIRDGGLDGKSEPLAQRTVLNYRNTLAEIFTHSVVKQYCAASPFERFTKEEYKALGGEKQAQQNSDIINILTVAEAADLLKAATTPEHSALLGSLVLRLFCGVRTTEVCKLDWSEVHWLDSKPFVHISAAKAKKRRIRLVEIPENALAWLKLCNPPKEGRIVPGEGGVKAYTNRFRKLIKTAGIGTVDAAGVWQSDWENNDTRHSFGSYHFAMHGDSVKTATQMGHKQGDDILFDRYRSLVAQQASSAQLVTEEVGQAYFNLRPAVAAGNVTQFPAAQRRKVSGAR